MALAALIAPIVQLAPSEVVAALQQVVNYPNKERSAEEEDEESPDDKEEESAEVVELADAATRQCAATSLSRVLVKLCPYQCLTNEVLLSGMETLVGCLCDYEVDMRGDVGSAVRAAALCGLCDVFGAVRAERSSLLSDSTTASALFTSFVGRALKQVRNTHTHTHTYTYIHTYIHTHTYTQKHTFFFLSLSLSQRHGSRERKD